MKFFWTIVGNFWKIEFLTEYRQAQTLQKWRKFCIISKCATKIFFCQTIISTHQRKCFSSILGNFWKIEFLTWYRRASPSQKSWKFCIISKCVKKIFFVKIIISTHQRKCFSTIKDNFWKIEFWWSIDRRNPYKSGENFVLSQNVFRIFFCQNSFIRSLKKCFSTILGNFENWILTKYL